MNASPEMIIAQFLLDSGVGVHPEADPNSDWPVFVSILPDERDSAIAIYGGIGKSDGRYMRGATVNHPGCQIIVRSIEHSAGYRKMTAIATLLDTLAQTVVVVDGDSYLIASFVQRPILSMGGLQYNNRKREMFSLNGRMTVSQI